MKGSHDENKEVPKGQATLPLQTHHNNRIKATLEDRIFDTVTIILMAFILIVTAYPFYYVLVLSFNDGLDATRGGIYLWPRKFTLENYARFLRDPTWFKAIFVSVAKTLVGAFLTIFFTCLVAYGLSYEDLLFSRFYNVVLLICMYFNAGLIPYFLVIRELGLLNTFWVYVIPTMFSIYYCLIARTFFRAIPKEIMESANLDGAGHLRIYAQMILPLSKPLIATLTLFAAVGQWNAWSDTAFFAPMNKDLRTLAFLLRDVIMQNQLPSGGAGSRAAMMASQYRTVTAQSVQMAAMIIAVGPILLVYPFLQKYFVSGVMLGSVKA